MTVISLKVPVYALPDSASFDLAGSCVLKSFSGLVIEMNFPCLWKHAVYFPASEQKEMRVS